jgi:hypothetical protein
MVAGFGAGDGDLAERRAACNYRNGLARYERLARPS